MDSEEWFDDESRAPRLLPVAALIPLLCGCLLLVAAAIAVPLLLPKPSLTILVAAGSLLGVVAWLAALPFGLYRAALPGKVGAALLLIAGGAGAGLFANRTYIAASREDASSFAEAEIGPNGALTLASGALGRGPISNLYLVSGAEINRNNERDVVAADFRSLYSPYLLEQDPSPLKRCDSVSELKAKASRTAEREKARTAKLAAAIDGSGLPDALRNGIRMMAVNSDTDANLIQQQVALDILEAQCQLLARRTWGNRAGYFSFGNAGDLAHYNATQARGRTVTEALAKLASAESDRMRQGQELVRDTLSQ